MLNNKLIDIEYIKNQIKEAFTKKIFSGSTASGNPSQIDTTWEALGKFKSLTIEVYKGNSNTRTSVELPFFLFSNGNNLNENKRVTNVAASFMLDGNDYVVHIVPGIDGSITSNTIKFNLASDIVINSIWVNY